MPIAYDKLMNASRLLAEAALKPLQGHRFQPTGFADLGPARYALPDGTEMLLVESAQSVANRMEAACWDEAAEDWIAELRGLPYVKIDCGNLGRTNTIREFHRLNSPYVWGGQETESAKRFRNDFLNAIGLRSSHLRKQKGAASDDDGEEVPGTLDFRAFHSAVFRWDPNAVLHGLFLEKVAGRLRMTRALSGFIEARGVRPADSGGTKVDHILPSPKALGLSADDGYGNVPYPRTEFTAEEIKGYFNLDLALLRAYAFPDDATKLLIVLALFKIRRFLSAGLRLRTACDLEVSGDVIITRPADFVMPDEKTLLEECQRLIKTCNDQRLFAGVTEVSWEPGKKRAAKKAAVPEAEGEGEADAEDEDA